VQESSAAGDWNVLYTRHQHENTVAQIFTNKGYEAFLPLYTVALGGNTGRSDFGCHCFLATCFSEARLAGGSMS
jgi:hypothetical protein